METDLLSWLRAQYSAGFSLEQIKQNLKTTQWTEDDLRRAMGDYEKDYPKPKSSVEFFWGPWNIKNQQDALKQIRINAIFLTIIWGIDFVGGLLEFIEPNETYLYRGALALLLVVFMYIFKSRLASGLLLFYSAAILIISLMNGFGLMASLVTLSAAMCLWATIQFHRLKITNR